MESVEIMVGINIYKIDVDKRFSFYEKLNSEMKPMGIQRSFKQRNEQNVPVEYTCKLYVSTPRKDKDLSWNWVLEEFNQKKMHVSSSPRGVIVFEGEDDFLYVVTFGHAFFLVDKFCDRDFGFQFARKLEYENIKTTTLTTPDSRRNKTVNTYIDYSELEFDSGESFAKLKAKVRLPNDFTLYKPSIEVGTSVRLSTNDNTLNGILSLILHVENTINYEVDKCNIPLFAKVKDVDKIARLDENLNAGFRDNPASINFSELEIVGASEIFNRNDCEYLFKYHGKEYRTTTLSNEELKSFCDSNELEYGPSILDAVVSVLADNGPVCSRRVKELIDYTDDNERCLLSKGVWYQYNRDYLTYLRDSISEIAVTYNKKFNFPPKLYNQFIESKYDEECADKSFEGKSKEDIIKKLKQKYYAERVFNDIVSKSDDFQNFDRELDTVGTAKVEPMDLYQISEEAICTVKIGNTSSKLCYAVDQSLTALKLYKKDQLHLKPDQKVSAFVLWFVLDRKGHIEDENKRPQLDRLDMLLLKNRLDQWKKEVRVQGFKPLVYINYREENSDMT